MGLLNHTDDKVSDYWSKPPVKKECQHEVRGRSSLKDFTYADTGEHLYCPLCKCHWYKNRHWTHEQWAVYVNNCFDGDCQF